MKFLYLNLALVFLFFCTPVNKSLIEKESQRKFEGFTSDSKFQVLCSINIFQDIEKSGHRKALLEICKNRLVTRLAEFKIAYDYNIKNLKFQSLNSRDPSVMMNKSILLNESVKILNFDQLSIDWKSDSIKLLLKHYGEYLPGRILYEWVENDREYCIYSIHKISLVSELKNTALPFGVEVDLQ